MQKRALILLTFLLIVLSLWASSCSPSKEPPVIRKQKIKGDVKVAVINCANVEDLARRVTFWLRKMGYDVIYYGSDTLIVEKTVVIDHTKRNKKFGKMLGGSIGCTNIIYEPDPDSLFDVTLIIGKDYRKYFRDAASRRPIY